MPSSAMSQSKQHAFRRSRNVVFSQTNKKRGIQINLILDVPRTSIGHMTNSTISKITAAKGLIGGGGGGTRMSIGGARPSWPPLAPALYNAKNFIILCQMFINFFSYIPIPLWQFGVRYFCPSPRVPSTGVTMITFETFLCLLLHMLLKNSWFSHYITLRP